MKSLDLNWAEAPAVTNSPALTRQAVLPNPAGAMTPFEAWEVETSVPARFTRIAEWFPHHLAVATAHHRWTYGELHRRSNQIAQALLARQFDPSRPVALLLSVDAPLVAGLLGILKAGGFSVALGPDDPIERLRAIREGSGAPLVIVSNATAAQAQELGWAEEALLRIESTTNYPQDLPKLVARPDDLAAVLYTSGSTGVAKGVAHSHQNFLHLARCMGRALQMSAEDRISFAYQCGVMGGARMLYTALLYGACLYPHQLLRQGFVDLGTLLNRERLTIFHLPVTSYRHFIAALSPEDTFPSVRAVLLGGESSGADCLEAFRHHFPPSAVLNTGYGSSEVGRACEYFMDHASQEGERLPSGYGHEGFEFLILSPEGETVPPGQPGELTMCSRYLTCGYWREGTLRRDGLGTAPHDPRVTVFRTGDLATLQADGKLQICGRASDRVKIRSRWVDLGTVERTLLEHPQVRLAAVVVVRQETVPDTLAAWIIPGESQPSPSELRTWLHRKLPLDVTPDAFVFVPEFPRTASGKVDRRALAARVPAVAAATAPRAGSLVPPRDALEHALCGLWARLLRRSEIGINDDFFDLGGHSLLAVQLISLIQRELGHELMLSAILECPTIETLAEHLRTQVGGSQRWQALVPIQSTGTRPPFFAVHGIGGGVLVFRRLAQLLGSDQPFYGLQAVTLGGACQEYDRVEEMAAHYLHEIRQVQPHGPYYLGGLSFGGNVALEIAQQLHAAGEQVALLALFDTRGPGYPQFPGLPARTAAHFHHFLKLSPAGRSEYLRTRAVSLVDLVRRRVLLRLHAAGRSQTARALQDIGITHLRAGRRYRRRPYAGRITFFRAEIQPIGAAPSAFCGWETVAQEGVALEHVPGDHVTLIHEPHVAALADRLRGCLHQARGESKAGG